jgi:hypothetical protein
MPIFFPVVMWCRVELYACFLKVSAPKTQGRTQDRFSGEGGSLTAPCALLHSRNVCLEKFSRSQRLVISNETHLAAKPKDWVVGPWQVLGIVRGGRQGKHCLNTEHLKTRDLLSNTRHLACAVAARLRSLITSRDSACVPLLVTVIHKCQPYHNSSHSQRATLKLKNNIQVH